MVASFAPLRARPALIWAALIAGFFYATAAPAQEASDPAASTQRTVPENQPVIPAAPNANQNGANQNGANQNGANQNGADQNTGEPERELTAAELNARQRINQTVTVRRTIDGKLVEERTVVVPNDAQFPVKQSEAGITVGEFARNIVDREVLTRSEAVAEADLEFTLADIDHNDQMSLAEFQSLYTARKNDPNYRDILSMNDDSAQPATGRYAAFAKADQRAAIQAAMADKFRFMAGIESTLTRRDYIREFLRDFDAMDANGDYILQADENREFRNLLLPNGAIIPISDE